jgi:chromosome partitioning protein
LDKTSRVISTWKEISADMTHSVSVCNQKGGVAKTTTCLSLGACLAEMGKTVLLIDLDPQANLTSSLALRPRFLRHSIADVLRGTIPPEGVAQRTGVAGLDILPANAALAVLEKALYRNNSYETMLSKAFSAMDPALYDYALIDCPPSLGPLTLNALTAANLMIIPTPPEFYALSSLQNVFALVKVVRRKTNPALRYRILVTMHDRRNSVYVSMLDHMRTEYQGALFDTVIEVDTRLRESPLLGVPITVYKPGTRAAQQYRALAREVVQYE